MTAYAIPITRKRRRKIKPPKPPEIPPQVAIQLFWGFFFAVIRHYSPLHMLINITFGITMIYLIRFIVRRWCEPGSLWRWLFDWE